MTKKKTGRGVAARAQQHRGHDTERTRQALLDAAYHLFSRKGYDGVSVKELADDAGVNISLISYHFGGKQGLYRACLEYCGRERHEEADRLFSSIQTREDLCRAFREVTKLVIDRHIERPQFFRIVQRDFDLGHPVAETVFRDHFLKGF